MPAPLGKHVRRPVASRPWNGGDRQGSRAAETEAQKREREACLNCTLPDCMPRSVTCPVGVGFKKREKREKLRPPEEFLDWAWGPMTNREWAERCGVSTSTINRWRQHYARQIHARKKKRTARDG